MKATFFLILITISFWGCNQVQNKAVETKDQKIVKATSQFVFNPENLRRYQFPTHINDLIIDRANSSFSEVFMVIIEPGKGPLLHKHDDTEQVFYMLEGKGTLTIGEDKKHFAVKPGDVVRIPVSTYHTIQADSGQAIKYLCVDCFGEKPKLEPTWDDHVKTVCKTNGWNYDEVVK